MAGTFVAGKSVWSTIREAVRQSSRGHRSVAVAYLGSGAHDDRLPLGSGDTLVADCSLTSAKDGRTYPREVRKFLEAGVSVFRCDHLHAKVYVLGNTAMVGSANVSGSSETRLEEAIVITRDPDIVVSARAFVESLAATQPPVDEAWLAKCEEVYRQRALNRGASPFTVPSQTVKSRLWLAATSTALTKRRGRFYYGDQKILGSGKLSMRAAERVAARRRKTGEQVVSLQYDERPPFDEGDLVIQCNYPPERVGGHTLAYAPSRVGAIEKRPEGARVVSLWRSASAAPLRMTSFQEKCADVAVVVPRVGDAPQSVADPGARRAILALWEQDQV